MPLSEETLEELSREPAGAAVIKALERLLAEDLYLLRMNVNERSITHKLAAHLQRELTDLHVDCEYNRDGVDPKKLEHLALYPDQEDEDAQTVFPDIIVHVRGTGHNYLVIELKKDNSRVSRDVDLAKLIGYRRELGYQYALFLEVGTASQAGVLRADWM